MKKIFVLSALLLFLSSCEKDYLVPDNEVPAWLRTRIAEDEQKISSDPHSGLDIAAWIRDPNCYFLKQPSRQPASH